MVYVYPNPSDGNFILDYVSPQLGEWRVEVFDAVGRLVKVVEVPFGYGGMDNIDMGHQVAGVYTLRVLHNQQIVTKRLMLVR